MTAPSPYADRLAAIPTSHHTVEVLGAVTHYWVYETPEAEGTAAGGTGPADAGTQDARVDLVAVHGFRGEHHGLEPVVAFLTGVRVVAPDLPGFGESEALPGREHSTATYAEWLAAFLRALDLDDDTVVLGHSFGSIVSSAAMAAGLPASRLILVNPIAAPALKGPRGVFTRLAVFYYWAGAALPERPGQAVLRSRVVTRISSMAMAKTKSKSLIRWIHEQHDTYFSRFANRRIVLESFKASVSTDVSSYAMRILVPTLLVAADRDDITALPAQYTLQKLFPNARLAVIEGVGHLIHYEKPREAAEAITAFLAPTTDGGARA